MHWFDWLRGDGIHESPMSRKELRLILINNSLLIMKRRVLLVAPPILGHLKIKYAKKSRRIDDSKSFSIKTRLYSMADHFSGWKIENKNTNYKWFLFLNCSLTRLDLKALWSLSCLASQQDINLLFDPIFIVRSISIAYFLVPEKKRNKDHHVCDK